MDLISFKCPSCDDYIANNLNSLRIHCQRQHRLTTRSLYASLFLSDGREPNCACGCGDTTKFISLQKGFAKYILGHSSRVKNNWGNNKQALEKSIETRRREERWSRDPWNRGKTKEDDKRLEEMGKTMSLRHGERYSKIMSENRLSGAIPSLTGSSHPQWKGGTSSIGALCNSSTRLYKLWKFPALQRAEFKCERCGSSDNLHVHHSKIRMAEIIHSCSPGVTELSWEVQTAWVERVIDWHIEKSPAAEVLCQRCHANEHPSLNFTISKLDHD